MNEIENRYIYEFWYLPVRTHGCSAFKLQIDRETPKMFYGKVFSTDRNDNLRYAVCNFALNKDQVGVATMAKDGKFLVRVLSDTYTHAVSEASNVLRNCMDSWLTDFHRILTERDFGDR